MPDRVHPLARGLSDGDLLQAIQDAAFGRHAITLQSKRLELPLEFFQVADALSHVLDVLVQNVVDGMTVLAGRILESKQRADFIERHVERAAMADEVELHQMGFSVATVAIGFPRGRVEQSCSGSPRSG